MAGFVETTVVCSFIVAEAVLIISSIAHYMYAFVSLFARPKVKQLKLKQLPFVTIQIPVYNEGEVVRKSIDACLALDYPKDRYEILVCDDSTDGITPKIVKSYGKKVKHVLREERTGYKAGALQNANQISKGEFIAIFDADFEPGADFLRKGVCAMGEKTAVVQGKWIYRNENRNFITKVASMMTDAFYEVVLPYRSVIGTVIFSGSGGILRKKAIEDAGGWNPDAIAEDLDLTIRMLCRGWETVYFEDIESLGEAPPSFEAFVVQQARWAFGTSQAAINHIKRIVSSEKLTGIQKFDMGFSSFGFFVMPFIVLAYVSGIINAFHLWIDPSLSVWIVITLLTMGYFFELVVASFHSRKLKNLLYLPIIFVFLAVMNFPLAKGVLDAVFGEEKAFAVTPKSGD
jgi:cellulose synthase/poly-beta-1,6-N-acetylglucosamine synthase-like glycosyltransferase